MIAQNVTPITPLPSFLAPERPAAVDNLVEAELPLLTEELAEVISQINSTETNINSKESSVTEKYNDMQPHFDDIDLVAAAIASGDLPTIIDDADTSALKTWSSEKIDSEIDIHNKTAKTTPVDADEFMTADSTSAWSLKKISWASIKTTLKTYFDTLYLSLIGNQTIAGIITFTTSPIVPTPTTSGNVITMDNIIQKTAVGIGYGTGSGGTVTQATSKSTSVTLNKPTGQITMNNAPLAGGASIVFALNNSLITLNDTITVTSTGLGQNYKVSAYLASAGLVGIRVDNITAGSLSDALVINFTVKKGAIS